MKYEITGHTRLGALLGSPVSHSISPQMYNDSFRQLGLDRVYLCFDITPDKLALTVQSFRDMNVFGFNLTMPDKSAVIDYLDDLSLEARLIGAVNTVNNEDGRLIGYNTDGAGYMKSAREAGFVPAGSDMVLIGCGGAASAIAVQAALDGISRLHILVRQGKSWNRALELTERITKETTCSAQVTDLADEETCRRLIEGTDLLTNATPVGMAPHEEDTPVKDPSWFHPGQLVSDIIYHPRQTRLLLEAKERGCRTFNGMYMLLYQGERAFHIWTGQDMPLESIRSKYFSM